MQGFLESKPIENGAGNMGAKRTKGERRLSAAVIARRCGVKPEKNEKNHGGEIRNENCNENRICTPDRQEE